MSVYVYVIIGCVLIFNVVDATEQVARRTKYYRSGDRWPPLLLSFNNEQSREEFLNANVAIFKHEVIIRQATNRTKDVSGIHERDALKGPCGNEQEHDRKRYECEVA